MFFLLPKANSRYSFDSKYQSVRVPHHNICFDSHVQGSYLAMSNLCIHRKIYKFDKHDTLDSISHRQHQNSLLI